MTQKKITRITIETHKIWVLRKGGMTIRRWWSGCNAEAEWVALESTGVLADLSPSAIEKWLNSGAVHYCRAEDGSRFAARITV